MKLIDPMRLVLCSLLLQISTTSPASDATLSVEQRLDRLAGERRLTPGMPSTERDRRIVAAYDELFLASADGSAVSDDDAHLLFRAARIGAFHGRDRAHVDAARNAFERLRSRGLARRSEIFDVYGMLVGDRDFDGARAVSETYPDLGLEALPAVSSDGRFAPGWPTAFELSGDAYAMRRVSRDIGSGPRVVIVGHPSCHFSANAAQELEGTPDLFHRFQGSATWLAPQDQQIGFQTVARWNRLHPQMHVQIAYRAEEWRFVDSWDTPTFYFLRDGVLKTKVVGWQAGTKAEIRDALATIGL